MSTPVSSRHALLSYEPPEDYDAFLAGMLRAHRPADEFEMWIVEEFAAAAWNWRRARAIDAGFWSHVGSHYAIGPQGIAEAEFQEKQGRYAVHLRTMAAAERQYCRALAAIERLRRERRQVGDVPAPESRPEPLAPSAQHEAGGAVMAAGAAGHVKNPAPETKPQYLASYDQSRLTAQPPQRNSSSVVDDSVSGCYSEPVSELAGNAKAWKVEGKRVKPGPNPEHLFD